MKGLKMRNLTPGQIMLRLARLDSEVCIRFRTCECQGRWYVHMPRVVCANTLNIQVVYLVQGFEGLTPEQAVVNAWEHLLNHYIGKPHNFLLRFARLPMPNNLQAWVRWNIKGDNWVDVELTQHSLNVNRIPRDRIIPYLNFR